MIAVTAGGVAVAETVGGSSFEAPDGALIACIASPASGTDVLDVTSDRRGGGVRIVKPGDSCEKNESREMLASAASLARVFAPQRSQLPQALFASKSVDFVEKTAVVSLALPAGSFLVQGSVGLAPPDVGLAHSRVISCTLVDPAGREVSASERTVTIERGGDPPFVVLSTQALLAGTDAGDAKIVCDRVKGGGRAITANASVSAQEVQTDKADPSCAADSICFWSKPNYKGTLVTVASPSLDSSGSAGCIRLPSGTKTRSVFSNLSSDLRVRLYPRGDGDFSSGGCSADVTAVATFDTTGVGEPDLPAEQPVIAVFVLKKAPAAAAEPPAPQAKAKKNRTAKKTRKPTRRR